MTSEQTTAADGTETAAPAARGGGALPVIMLVAGLATGGLAGWLVAGPGLVRQAFPGGIPAAFAATPATSCEELLEEHSGKPVGTHVIENLIVNPAGTQGTRFLLLTLAFESRDTQLLEALKQRDVEVRDAILNLLGSYTIPELSEVERREQVKDAVRERLHRLLGRETIGRIHFPQFVIQ